MIDLIINKIIEILKKDAALSGVQEWRSINGLVPSRFRSVSVGCDKLSYAEYTNMLDECNADVKIYMSLDNRELPTIGRRGDDDRLEYGERAIREFAQNVRSVLTDNYTLDGVVAVSMVDEVEFVTIDEYTDLHIAAVSLSIKYYVERQRNYRTITLPIIVNSVTVGNITQLPIKPIIGIEIEKLTVGKDYVLCDDGIKWQASVPDDEYLITIKFRADAVKVNSIGMNLNGENTEFKGSE